MNTMFSAVDLVPLLDPPSRSLLSLQILPDTIFVLLSPSNFSGLLRHFSPGEICTQHCLTSAPRPDSLLVRYC